MPTSAGDRLGPYEIVSPIGAGGMGEVYKARDTRLNRTVAIKVLPEHVAARLDSRARFEREARTVASLNHPNICTLHDIGPGYLVMEMIEGETLAALIAKGALPLDQAIRFAAQIADALDRAHRAGVTHRDVKPQNIMLTRDGVKVLDFGLAKSAARPGPTDATLTAGLTTEGTVVGTPQYMAPEQLDGKEADARSDIWAFGAVLYEMATGHKAFQGKTYPSLVGAIVSADPPPMEVKPFTPAWLERLVRRCLAKDPEDRWQSMRDVVIELRTPPHEERGARPSMPVRWLWMVAAGSTLVAAVLGVAEWRAIHRPAATLKPLIRLDVDLGPDAVTTGTSNTFAISPGGERVVFTIRGADGKTRLATRLLSEDTPTILEGTEDAQGPFFSPDSAWIAYGTGGTLRKVSTRGGVPVVIADAPSFSGGTWTDQGMLVGALVRDSALSRVPAAGGTPEPLGKLSGVDIDERWPQALPGGKYVLASAVGSSGLMTTVVISTTTGQATRLVEGGYGAHYVAGSAGGQGASVEPNDAGELLYLRDSSLFAVGFDPRTLAITGSEVLVTDEVGGNPGSGAGQWDVSRNGVLLHLRGRVAATGTRPILWMDRTGQTRPLVSEPRDYRSLSFSPDGNRLALSALGADRTSEMLVYDLARDVMSRLISVGSGKLVLFPVWTPDGKHIISAYPGPSGFGLAWYGADGGGEPQVLLDSDVLVLPTSVSPDGGHVAYARQDPVSQADIWMLPLNTSDPEHPKAGKPEVFLKSPAFEAFPTFSPDGHWVGYRSDETGRNEVYVRSYPGPGGKVQISKDGGNYPLWSSDGRSLYFQDKSVGADGHMMVVDYELKGGALVLGKAHQLSPALTGGGPLPYSLHPDGKRLAIFSPHQQPPEQKGSTHVRFLLNVGDELRRLRAAK
jgi:serine/threonine-protein kinase